MAKHDTAIHQLILAEPVSGMSQTLPLKEAAAEITALASASDDLTLQAARKTAAVKARLRAGEAGEGVKWMAWMRMEIKLSESHIYQLIKIGEADNPAAELEEWRRAGRERKKEQRAAKKQQNEEKEEMTDNHKTLLSMIPKLSEREATDECTRMRLQYPRFFN